MKVGTVEDLKNLYILLKSLDGEKPRYEVLKKWQRAEKPEEVTRFDMNGCVNNLAIAIRSFEAGGSGLVNNIEELNKAYQKELPLLRKIFSADKMLFETIRPNRPKGVENELMFKAPKVEPKKVEVQWKKRGQAKKGNTEK